MEEIDKLMKEMKVNTFDVGSSYWVDITYINNPHSFYVRPRTYNMYLPIVHTRGEILEPSEVKVGTIVLLKSKIQKSYIRGKVISIKGGDIPVCDLYAIDFGFTETSVPLRKIRKPYYQLNLPSLVTHCQLADCAPQGVAWDDKATNAMRKYVEGERAKVIVRSKTIDRVIVEIYNTCPDDISTLLALTGFTTFGYVPNSY